jgi:hypothetical protein
MYLFCKIWIGILHLFLHACLSYPLCRWVILIVASFANLLCKLSLLASYIEQTVSTTFWPRTPQWILWILLYFLPFGYMFIYGTRGAGETCWAGWVLQGDSNIHKGGMRIFKGWTSLRKDKLSRWSRTGRQSTHKHGASGQWVHMFWSISFSTSVHMEFRVMVQIYNGVVFGWYFSREKLLV